MGIVAQAIDDARRVAEQLRELDPGLAEDEQAFFDTLDGETDAIDVARRFCRWKLHVDDHAKDLAAIIERRKKDLAERGERLKRFQAQSERLRDIVHQILQAATPPGKKPGLREADFTAYVNTQSDKQVALVEVDPAQTPPDLMVTPPAEPNRAAIKDRLLAKKTVPGWALANPKSWLVITTR